MAGCGRPEPLPVLSTLPEFQLVDQAGQPFDSRSLDGHVWVANFVFTTCTGPCPMMSSQMRRVQNSTAGTPDVKLVSFTVDPAHDTPPVLAAYAKNFGCNPARWHFLTGDQARLDDLGRNGFKLNSVDGSLNHSTRFVLVDRARRIRGYYASSEEGFLKKLIHDLRRLEDERT
jgi:protein SCO1